MTNLFDHVKKVAMDDVRLFFAPFVGVYAAIREELHRPPIRSWTKPLRGRSNIRG